MAITTDLPAPSSDGDLRRRAWRWHFLAALLVIPFVLWQSTTGTMYVWSQAWVDAAHPELRFTAPAGERASLDEQVAAARVGRMDGVASVIVPADPRRSTEVLFEHDGGLPTAVFVDPWRGSRLGALSGMAWPVGWTRKLHGGWPLGNPGSWLLELGACWAIVMVLTGLYLWWPRDGRRIAGVWLPRIHQGARVFWRDLHACVAVWWSLVIVLFLFTALPWTSFWGGHVLQPMQRLLGQSMPAAAGFAPVFASGAPGPRPATLEGLLRQARSSGLDGDLTFMLVDGPPGSAISVRNSKPRSSQQRYVLLDRNTGGVVGQARWQDFPATARMVATGVDLHEGRYFGNAGPWINTTFAVSLVWLCITGAMSWWRRRPKGSLAVPARPRLPWPMWLRSIVALLCAVLPLLGVSVLALWLGERAWLRFGPTAAAT